ncbi:MAG TPA: acetate/propionate family kinase [Geminicoccus sp.]|jgi:acetate kinase|uniref:acetate/propionate family kinase n=1 Tax=Geminicoccus sp. TaxID=2024832 RepID=UPI002E358993|nr:acetate/propionate family kinase [Geminicoccus sp.]HEX2525169.1 acetate/propionate family kinase [Geminicoccus sp.]
MRDTILVINAGSSSIKFQLFGLGSGDALDRRFKGQIEGIGGSRPRLEVKDASGKVTCDQVYGPEQAADVKGAQDLLGGWLVQQIDELPIAVGHRVVHGGPDFVQPMLVDDTLLDRLEALVPLAPLHQPNNLAPIRSIRDRRPELPQVACFDTAFHRSHPAVADHFAVPEELYREGVRRYGFHGLSYEYIATRLPAVAPAIARGRVVVAHLGSGCSACAMAGGRSIDSTMGFTALDGLPMGTRPGQLDAGVVLYLMQQGKDARAIEHFLYHECGLKGLSGLSNDVRDLLASDDPRAKLALDYFGYRTAQAIAALASSMGGLDGIVFTAGIGEHAAPVRADICRRCRWMGVDLDEERKADTLPRITTEASAVPVFVVPTNEEWMIARHTLAVVRAKQA